MSRARRSACPSPASRPPRPRSARRRRARRDDKTKGSRQRHVRGRKRGRAGCAGRFPSATAKGGGLCRGRGGRGQSPVRLGRQAGHVDRGRDVAVSPLRRRCGRVAVHRFPHHRHPAAALRARRFQLMLSFLLFPLSARFRDRIRWWDIAAGVMGAAILVYAIEGGEEFTDRATMPTHLDVVLGVVFIILLLEATRRTTGWIVPCVALSFMAYATAGPYLPPPWTHRGYDISQLVGHLFITLEGIFGIPVDVSSSLIILFTIYGAFLQHSGAGKFFIDFSMALMGHKANSDGRTVVLSSFLLGGPSGSGVATTVTIGAVAYPLMQKGGFREERGRRAARGGRPRRHHLSAGPGRRRLPDRRVPEDQLPRRDLDGDH